MLPLQAPGETSFPCLFLLHSLHFLACGPFLHLQSQHLSILLQAYCPLSHCSKICLCLYLIEVLVVTFKIHSGNLGYSFRLKILNLTLSAKSFVPYQITFTGSRNEGQDIFGNYYSAVQERMNSAGLGCSNPIHSQRLQN